MLKILNKKTCSHDDVSMSHGNYGKQNIGFSWDSHCPSNCDSDFVFAFSHCKSATTERRVGKRTLPGMMVSTGKYPYELGLSAVERNIVL